MPIISQIPRTAIVTPNTVFHTDIVLEEPNIVGTQDAYTGTIYGNNAKICTIYGAVTRLIWEPVENANFYVVHLCKNSSFTGPTLSTYTLNDSNWTGDPGLRAITSSAGNQLNFEITYYWRVMAYNKTGGASPKSTVYQFTFSCEDQTNNPGGAPSGGSSGSSGSGGSSGSSGSPNCVNVLTDGTTISASFNSSTCEVTITLNKATASVARC